MNQFYPILKIQGRCGLNVSQPRKRFSTTNAFLLNDQTANIIKMNLHSCNSES